MNGESIAGTNEILWEIAKQLGLFDKIVRNKIILLKSDLFTIQNSRCAIYQRQSEHLPSSKFHQIEPVAGLFHLKMKVLSMLFDWLWGIAGDIVSLNHYTGILKQKYIAKAADNNHFQYFHDFLQMVIKVLIITLYLHLAKCSTIYSFHT